MPLSTRAYGCLLSQLVIRSALFPSTSALDATWMNHVGWKADSLDTSLLTQEKSNWAGGWAAEYHSLHLEAWSSPGVSLLTNCGWSQRSVSELLVPLFPNWIWSWGTYVAASFSNPWFIPGCFCKFTCCACLPGTAEPLARWIFQMLL